jgi:hypothetical protein
VQSFFVLYEAKKETAYKINVPEEKLPAKKSAGKQAIV